MSAGNVNNLTRYFNNPRLYTMRQWFVQLLGARSAGHEETIERVAASLTAQGDVEAFGKLVMQVYEAGYLKAVEDYKQQAEKIGLRIDIVRPSPQSAD